VLNPAATSDWQLAYLEAGPPREQMKIWKRFQETLTLPFLQYSIPRIALHQKTTKDAVCQVFEKVNTGGVELTVFELLTATYAAENFRLRNDWESRQATWADETPLDVTINGWAPIAWLAVVVILAGLASFAPARRAAGLTVRDTLAYQ
jgi:hypothetical protein